MTIKALARCAAVALMLAAAWRATAQLSTYEAFAYDAGAELNGQAGGFGFATPWTTPGGLPATITSDSLSYNTLPVAGRAVASPAWPDIATYTRELAAPLGADGTTEYLSFLFQPQAGCGFYGGLNFGGVFVGRSGNQAFYGLEGPVGDLALSSTPVVAGETVLLVLKVQFAAGADRVDLFVNPSLAGEPAPSATKTNVDVGTVNYLYLNNAGGFAYDELRCGADYASVVPEPASFLALLAAAFFARGARR